MSEYASYRAKDKVASHFISDLHNIITFILTSLRTTNSMMTPLAHEQLNEVENVTHCYICRNKFPEKDIRVHDHCHWTGGYKGAAHKVCNLNLKCSYTLPVILHYLSNCGAHFLITDIVPMNCYQSNFHVIASTS